MSAGPVSNPRPPISTRVSKIYPKFYYITLLFYCLVYGSTNQSLPYNYKANMSSFPCMNVFHILRYSSKHSREIFRQLNNL